MISNAYFLHISFSNGDTFYGTFTLIFIFTPMLLALALEIFDFVQTHQTQDNGIPWKQRIKKVLYHLPAIQLIQHWIFLRDISKAAEAREELNNFKIIIFSALDSFPELDQRKLWDKYSVSVVLEDYLSGLEVEKLQKLILLNHDNIKGSFTGSASNELKEVISNEEKKSDKVLAEINMKVQEFKVLETFGESCLQFVLQTCAVLYNDPTLSQELSTIQILTIVSSFLSVVLTLTTVFQQMPYVLREKIAFIYGATNKMVDNEANDIPDEQTCETFQEVEEAPFQTIKTKFIVGPVMAMAAIPRLLAMTILFTSCRGVICFCIIGGALVCYSITFWSLAYYEHKGHGKKTWKLLAMSFGSSVIGPCISIDPRSKFIFTSFLISMMGHIAVIVTLLIIIYVDPTYLTIPVQENVSTFKLVFWIMLPAISITSLMSYILLEEVRQHISLMIRLGSNCCPEDQQLQWAYKRGYFKHIKRNKKVLKRSPTKDDMSVFHTMCEQGQGKLVAFLMKHHHIKEIINQKDDYGMTGFLKACFSGKLDVVRMILESEVSEDTIINDKDAKGRNGFILAYKSNHLEVARLFLNEPYRKLIEINEILITCVCLLTNYLYQSIILNDYMYYVCTRNQRPLETETASDSLHDVRG